MDQLISGIHHITALASDAQKNIDFYAGILGLRLVKKTVNFDAPDTYHFYYGDETGSPGTILTFFPYQGLVRGRHGKGMVNTTTFSVALSSLDYWTARLTKFAIPYKSPEDRFNSETVIYFEDKDGLGIELVFNDRDPRKGFSYGQIPIEHAIRGFFSAEIWQEGYERTAGLLTGSMDHQLIAEKGNRFRFAAKDAPGNYIDILCSPDSLRGLGGSGTVHHIAFATADAASQKAVREKLSNVQMSPTPVLDRTYFTSIYFREPGGVLFEVATAGPGFQIDESAEALGTALKLPPQYEAGRQRIEKELVPVTLSWKNFA
jgi:glyoxalase family protein